MFKVQIEKVSEDRLSRQVWTFALWEYANCIGLESYQDQERQSARHKWRNRTGRKSYFRMDNRNYYHGWGLSLEDVPRIDDSEVLEAMKEQFLKTPVRWSR